MKKTMKKKLTLNKIKIAALNDKEKGEIVGGLSASCNCTSKFGPCHTKIHKYCH